MRKAGYVVRFARGEFDALADYLLGDPAGGERHAFIYCHTARSGNRVLLFPRRIIGFADDDPYVWRSPICFSLDRDVLHRIHLDFADSEYTSLISCHSHPFEDGEVEFSPQDDANDRGLMKHFYREVLPAKAGDGHFLSLVMGRSSVAARGFVPAAEEFVPVAKIVALGEPVRVIRPGNAGPDAGGFDARQLDRQIRAFGEEGMRRLAGLRVGIIGAGSTGSIAAEGVVRLGVKDVVLIDGDMLEASNLNRWQGARPRDVGRRKTDVLKERLKSMTSGLRVRALPRTVLSRAGANALKGCDCILGCVDSHPARYFLNRLACQYLIPYVDAGSGIIARQGRVEKLASRVSAVVPSVTGCMDCSPVQYYDSADVHRRLMRGGPGRDLERAGYVQYAGEVPSPAVYPLNMLAASLLLTEFMNVFLGFREVYWNTLVDLADMGRERQWAFGTDSGSRVPGEGCLCCNEYLAQGDAEPLEMFYGRRKSVRIPR